MIFPLLHFYGGLKTIDLHLVSFSLRECQEFVLLVFRLSLVATLEIKLSLSHVAFLVRFHLIKMCKDEPACY